MSTGKLEVGKTAGIERVPFISTIASATSRWSTRWVPDAYVIAVLLTFIAAAFALIFTPSSLLQIIDYWGQGFWVLLTFGMQMALVVFTGYVLAVAPPVGRLLNQIAGWAKTPRQAVFIMAVVSMVLGLINWGLSIVGSAVFVRYLARKVRGVDYRLLVAAAYLGLGTTWHAGLSASAPLLVATPKHFLEAQIGIIPVTQTIFNPFNMLMVLAVIVVLSIITPLMSPRKSETVEVEPALLEEMKDFEPPVRPELTTPAVGMENSPLVNLAIGLMGLVWLANYFWTKGLVITLDVVNFTFLMLGVLLHRTPASLLKAAQEAGGFVWGIILQFPFYAGIFGIVNYSHLSDVIGNWFVSISTARTYPLIVYWYSGLLNYFVPSGGSKWAIEAPYILSAAKTLGVSANTTVLAYAWGDMMTDIIQPFWAIPLLGVAKLKFRDIMGFCIVIFIVYAILVSLGFYFLPF
ncbi:MAG: TIGR00366 family protein [Firmicutes bacterium]|nr:TIGR00366 family protein [Bacillota bacterium]